MFSNRDARTLLDKLVTLLFSVARACNRKLLLIAHACYASAKLILPLTGQWTSIPRRPWSALNMWVVAPSLRRACLKRVKAVSEQDLSPEAIAQ